LLLTREAWRPEVLRIWPSALRLLLVAAVFGSCAGLGLFATRAQVGAQSGLTSGSSPLQVIHVGAGTPTPNLYAWTPYPTQAPTATPTKTRTPTPTAGPVQFAATLSAPQAQCNQLVLVTLTLDNSKSSVAVTWTATASSGPGGLPAWATVSPSSDTIPKKGTETATVTPDSHLCNRVDLAGNPYQGSVQVSAMPGGQNMTLPFLVLPATVVPSPTPSA
jgi:hypothetical protein